MFRQPLTMFESIKKFPQGSYGISGRALKIEKVFHPQHNGNSQSVGQIVKTIEKKIDDAVERQLVSDRPLGVYLSAVSIRV